MKIKWRLWFSEDPMQEAYPSDGKMDQKKKRLQHGVFLQVLKHNGQKEYCGGMSWDCKGLLQAFLSHFHRFVTDQWWNNLKVVVRLDQVFSLSYLWQGQSLPPRQSDKEQLLRYYALISNRQPLYNDHAAHHLYV